MKTAPNNSQLDAFISNTLKNAAENFQPFDWSEVEVLLKHELRSMSMPVQVNKKTMFMAGAAAGVLILVFAIFKIAQHYSSLPPEPETVVDPTQNTFNTIDTASTVKIDSSALQTGNAQIDSTAFFAAQKRKADSLVTVSAADSIAKAKAGIPSAVKIKDKKKMADTLQKATGADTTPPIIIVDTTSAPVHTIELIPETPAVLDTSRKTPPAVPPGKKKKSKKPVPPPAEQKTDPPAAPAPSDSLK